MVLPDFDSTLWILFVAMQAMDQYRYNKLDISIVDFWAMMDLIWMEVVNTMIPKENE